MDYKTEQEFIKESNIEIITKLMNYNNGYITSKLITELGIHRMYLNLMVENNIIEKVGNGIYLDVTKYPDNYYILNINYQKTIYSHMTALYFHGLSIKAPDSNLDITVPKKYNVKELKNHNVFYVNDDIYDLGITEVETPMGNKVRCYDIERCICDIIRSKNRMDIEHVKYSVRQYIKRKDKDLVKLSEYADKLGNKDEIMNFISIMYE